MPWNDADEIIVAQNGQAYFAPVGTTLPAKAASPTAALNSAFIGAGWITEDGASLQVGNEVQDFPAWQTRQPIRREKTSQEIQCAFAMQQWNEETVPFAFGGGVVTSSNGVYCYTFPLSDDALDERSLILDAIDGDEHYRIVFPRGNVTEDVESEFKRDAVAALPVTFKVLEPVGGGDACYFNTDAAGFAAGS